MDTGKKGTFKRLAALTGALLFILLIINIFIWQFFIAISLGIYVLLIMLYLFVFNRRKIDETDENVTDGDKEG